MDESLTWLDATAQADLVRAGEISPVELVEAAIERVERCDPSLNAVIHQRFEAARAEAARASAVSTEVGGVGAGRNGLPGGLPTGRFRGVPMLFKDLGASQAGEPYCEGTRFAKAAGYRAERDSYLVQRFREAGFVALGRTNTPELGTTITTEPMAFGATRNPWNTEHSSGGSSGGAASAVASGMVPLAHASDGGGSIRIPASCCGLFGLKPSRGRVSKGPDPAEAWMGFATDHVVTRSVRDSAGVLDEIAGYFPGDTFVAPQPARPFADEVGADPGKLRVGLLDHPAAGGYGIDAECAKAVREAGRLLESLGHRVEPAHPRSLEDADFQRHFLVVVTAAVAASLERWSKALGRQVAPEEYEPLNTLFTALGRQVNAPQYLQSVLWLEGFRRRTIGFWAEVGYDLLLTPVLARQPARLGELTDPVEGQRRVVETLQFTGQFNVSGQPAASLPLYWTPAGLPIGVQLVADYGREDLLIRIASQIEQAHPWDTRRPPVHA